MPIYCRISTSSTDRTEYYTKIRIEESLWLKTPKRSGAGLIKYIKGNSENSKAMNKRLNLIEEKILKAYNKNLEEDIAPSALQLKNALTGTNDKTIQDVFAIKIERASEKTRGTYQSNVNAIQKFIEEEFKEETIKLSSFRLAKYKGIGHRLLDWGKGKYSNAYIKVLFSKIKEALDLAVEIGYIENHPVKYTLKNVNSKSKSKDNLTSDEVRMLEEITLNNEELARTRDIFLFQVYTGLSIIDVKKLSPTHLTKGIDGRDWIIKNRQKSGSEAKIPLIRKAKKILDDYDFLNTGALPVEKHNYNYNSMIEKIIKKLGIEKHITSHCARHTFATLLRDAGSDLNNIKDIAGHSDTSMTQIYAKMTPKKLSDEMDKLDKMLGS
jgi:integrase